MTFPGIMLIAIAALIIFDAALTYKTYKITEHDIADIKFRLRTAEYYMENNENFMCENSKRLSALEKRRTRHLKKKKKDEE